MIKEIKIKSNKMDIVTQMLRNFYHIKANPFFVFKIFDIMGKRVND